MSEPYNLERFVTAQDPVYGQACDELRRGRKTGHWMWFVFPQLQGLGLSAMSLRYAIGSRGEAEAFLRHPVLGARLRECTALVNGVENRSVEQIFGYPDNMKFRSSMTLFAQVSAPDDPFEAAIDKYFGGEADDATLSGLKQNYATGN